MAALSFFFPFAQSLVLKRCGGLQKKIHTHKKKPNKKKFKKKKKPNKRLDEMVTGFGVGGADLQSGLGVSFLQGRWS